MKKRDHLSCFCSCMHHYQYMPVEWDTNYRDLPQEGYIIIYSVEGLGFLLNTDRPDIFCIPTTNTHHLKC